MADRDLSCREVVAIVGDYLEGVLPPAEAALVEGHLAECPGCVTYLEQFRATIAATRQLSEADLAPTLREELVRAFRDWPRQA